VTRGAGRRLALRSLVFAQGCAAYRRVARRVGSRAVVREGDEKDLAAVKSFLGLEQVANRRGAPMLLVACLSGHIGAWVWVAERPQDNEAFPGVSIWTLGVRTPFRGLGLGSALVESAVARARSGSCDRVSAVVGVSNNNALRMYRKLGFVEHRTSTLDEYLLRRREHGADSVVMVRWLG
jgi:ribosomal protein S18 acetylase RimI-like enzyme